MPRRWKYDVYVGGEGGSAVEEDAQDPNLKGRRDTRIINGSDLF